MQRRKQSHRDPKSSPAITDKQRLPKIRRKLNQMESVVKHPPKWVVKHFDDEASPRLLVAQTMALEVIRKVRQAAGWE